jgi:carboxymethylenebutenolidase
MPVCIVRTIRNVVRGEGPIIDDMLGLRDWLAARPDVDPERIAVAGFCMGGGFALLLGSLGEFKAAAPYYGDVAPKARRYRDICPVVAGYGGRDLAFAKKAPLLEEHLRELGVPHDVKIYPDAGHSYMSQHSSWLMAIAPFTPLRARYDEEAAEDSWRRMLGFFREHLGGGRAGASNEG